MTLKGVWGYHTSHGKGVVGDLAFYLLVLLSIGSFCSLQTQSIACSGSFQMPKTVSSMLSAVSVVAEERFIELSEMQR